MEISEEEVIIAPRHLGWPPQECGKLINHDSGYYVLWPKLNAASYNFFKHEKQIVHAITEHNDHTLSKLPSTN